MFLNRLQLVHPEFSLPAAPPRFSTREPALKITDAHLLYSIDNATVCHLGLELSSLSFKTVSMISSMDDSTPEDLVGAALDSEIASLQSQSKQRSPSPHASTNTRSICPQSTTETASINNSLLLCDSLNPIQTTRLPKDPSIPTLSSHESRNRHHAPPCNL